jgi:hypothetical protein
MSTVTIHRRIQEYEVVRASEFEPLGWLILWVVVGLVVRATEIEPAKINY